MEPLAAHDVALVRADNPGPFSLTGTNTWIVGRDPAWVIDPGPALPVHLAASWSKSTSRQEHERPGDGPDRRR